MTKPRTSRLKLEGGDPSTDGEPAAGRSRSAPDLSFPPVLDLARVDVLVDRAELPHMEIPDGHEDGY